MVCRSTPGNSAITTFARLHSGVDDVQVLSMFHEQRNAAPRTATAPSRDEYVAFLRDLRSRVLADDSLSAARRESILDRLERAETQMPDAPTYYAWRTIGERAVRARTAMDAHFAEIARRRGYGTTAADVQAAFNRITEENRAAGRSATRPSPNLPYDPAGVSQDRATRYALEVLYRANPSPADAVSTAAHAVPDTEPGDANQCPDCGQFAGNGHTCPDHFGASDATTRLPGLREAQARLVSVDGGAGWETTDGQTWNSLIRAARHERDIMPRIPVEPAASPWQTDAEGPGSEVFQVSPGGASHEQAVADRIQRARERSDADLRDLRDRLVSDGQAQQCPDCGQFAAIDHACPGRDRQAIINEAAQHAVQAARDLGDTPEEARLEGLAAAERAETTLDQQATVSPTRQRTALRTYRTPRGDTVQMTNLSQIRTWLRAAPVGDPVSFTVADARITDPETGRTAIVRGDVAVRARSARRGRNNQRDRLVVSDHYERSLRCTCAEYRANYDCVHVRQARENITAALNDRTAGIAMAPRPAVEQVRADLHAEYQGSLAAQQQARADFTATSDGISYAEDMTAFQTAWDEAKARLEAGDTRLPYLTEHATGGLGVRNGGRSFGIEIEVDFPDDMTYTAKQRVAQELYDAGLAESPEVHGWHWSGRRADHRGRRMGGGYSDAPNRWAVEFDRSVDDVQGQRGCEIVSPIMYDEPRTWENIAKVCEIVERNGGRATPRTGLHVNVGAADFDHTVDNHNRLLRLGEAYEDVLLRCAHNPQSGDSHRGRNYCGSSRIPAGGYRRISDAQAYNSHRSMINLDHVPAEGSPVTSSTRVEVRIFDGTTDKGRLQANIKVALGLVNAATRGVEPGIDAEPAGTHLARHGGRRRRLAGEAWTEDTASFRRFADALFSREEDKRQLVGAFAASRWQRQ